MPEPIKRKKGQWPWRKTWDWLWGDFPREVALNTAPTTWKSIMEEGRQFKARRPVKKPTWESIKAIKARKEKEGEALPEERIEYVADLIWYDPTDKKFYDIDNNEISVVDALAAKNAEEWNKFLPETQKRYAQSWAGQQGWLPSGLDEKGIMSYAGAEENLSRALARQEWIASQKPTEEEQRTQQLSDLQNLLSSLDPYSNWIERYQVQRAINMKVEAAAKEKWARGQVGVSGEERRISRREEFRGGAPEELPSSPEWLAGLVPGLTTGKMITKQPVPPPSGQQLTQMPWTQAAMLGGYTGWAGQNWRDILGQAELMQPRTPQVARRWRPAAQRV